MDLILYILAMMAAILVVLVLLAFIIEDIKKVRRYHNATRVQGVICENYGSERVAYYGRHQYKNFGKYVVRFGSPFGMQTQEILLKNRNLKKGDMVEVRYVMSQEGIQLVDNISGARLLHFGIIFLIVLPICLLFIYMEGHGM